MPYFKKVSPIFLQSAIQYLNDGPPLLLYNNDHGFDAKHFLELCFSNGLKIKGCAPFLVKRQTEQSRKKEKWNNLVNSSVIEND